jgi:hypothetical protein
LSSCREENELGLSVFNALAVRSPVPFVIDAGYADGRSAAGSDERNATYHERRTE